MRRALGFRRSEKRMQEVEAKLRRGMAENGITGETQEVIIQSITAFALYGFPESHAASFALIAYASAYLKCHYLAAFTAALLNNQPMGFYHPATIVKDAQRHGLRVLPVDVTISDVKCTLELPALRLGLNYVKGLRAHAAEAIVVARSRRPFTSMEDFRVRVPVLNQEEMRTLAEIGAFNFIGPEAIHRRDALWSAARLSRPAGPLLEALESAAADSPLNPMTPEERVVADFQGTGVTIGMHPIGMRRAELDQMKVTPAADLGRLRDGQRVRIAGCVICRQRPGTAHGFLFLSLEDETGISNAIVTPDQFDRNRFALTSAPYLLIEGMLQNQQGAISVKLDEVRPLEFIQAGAPSHDFH